MIAKTLSIYWSAMRPRKWLWLVAFLAHTFFFIGVNVLQPLLISQFVGELSNISGKVISDFYRFIWIWVGLHVIQTAFGRIGIYSWFHALAKTLMDIDLKSFRATLSQSSDFFANNFTGSLVTKFNRFTRSFDVISTSVMFDLNSLMVQVAFPFIILLFVSPVIALVFFVWSVLFALSLVYLHKKKLPRARAVAEYDSKVTGSIADTLTNALSVKMFARYSAEHESFRLLGLERVKARMRNMIFGDVIRVYKVFVITILEVPVFLLSAKFAIEGKAGVADIVLIQLYIQQLIRSLWDFGKLVEKLEEALADSTEMAEIYALTPSIRDPAKPGKFESIKGHIKLNDIDFRYKGDNEEDVFSRLKLDIPVGQKIGFVGPSGGGKTTLTKLLLRFMDVTKGTITIDGHNIAKVTQDDLRRNIAYVPQEPLLFHRSIYDNIAYGDPSASREEIMEAARLAHADEFIDRLPHGYETFVGERGVKLSGGQKQRVAIARAMLKKAPILVLDEATSALDSKSEKHITAALDSLMQNRTTIVIAHRLSTIRKLDRIVVLKDGKAVEDGSHDELLKQKGLYSELWQHQHSDFLTE